MFGNNKIKIVAFILAFLFFPSPASMGGTASYIHDAHLNRLIRVKYVTGGTTQVLYYTYDKAGNRTAQLPFAKRVMIDFDADGLTDIAVYRASYGEWHILPSSTGEPYTQTFGGGSDFISVAGDYDGDGKTDIAIYQKTVGEWYIVPSSTGTCYGVGWGGDASDIPVRGDYDGDGKTDIAIFRKSTGEWRILLSSTGQFYGYSYTVDASDIPVPGDYDGDGKTDIAIFRKSTGQWFMLLSSTGDIAGFSYSPVDPNDLPVPRDYDGDGKTDIAIYRSGYWYIRYSSTLSVYGIPWGNASDVPVPGDYEGDGKADVAVYRPSSGLWGIIFSYDNTTYIEEPGWGSDLSDMPVIFATLY